MNKPESLPNKPAVQRLMDLARRFRSAPSDLYDNAYKELQDAAYEELAKLAEKAEPTLCDGCLQPHYCRAGGCIQPTSPPATAALVEAAEKAAEQMERARNILAEGNPRPECNWGMLDPSALRAAIEAHKGKV